MAIQSETLNYKTFHSYPVAWMEAAKQIFELQSDLQNNTTSTDDSRFSYYEILINMIRNKEVEYETEDGNQIFASTVPYSGNYNCIKRSTFFGEYNFYVAVRSSNINVEAEVAKIKTGTQNELDKQEPIISDPSKEVSPSGKHYSASELRTVITGRPTTYEDAIIKLAGQEKYKKDTSAQVNKPADAITDNNKTPSNSSGSSQPFSSDLDKKKNEQLAKEHPERVVDGVYYADDDALKKAKEAKEERIKEETAAATAEAKANAEKLASTLSTIQQTLYGSDNSEAVDQLTGTVGGVDLNSALGDAASVRKRQKLLNFKTFIADYKEPSSGKPANNADPFPVDQKIEEFESHQPRVKIHTVTTHVHGQAATIAAMSVSDNAEKRIVRLENNMATIMRYLFRLGTRVSINCQYWGH